uniref:Neprosin PEP catalytic domain-containing protein n=3 Tax=Triticinae TaxID=1648030 RepID=A0A453J4C6_AEGTS
MDCPGFIRVDGARVAPGDAIQPVSNVPHGHMQNITIRVLKERTSGDWWVYYGFNSVPTGVGRFPRSSFTYLADKANHFAFGGAVISHRADPTPPMGSGSFPNGGQGRAASFTNLRIIDEYGNSKPITADLPVLVTNNKCHTITPINHGECLYGGPGGCVR